MGEEEIRGRDGGGTNRGRDNEGRGMESGSEGVRGRKTEARSGRQLCLHLFA